MLTWVEIFCNTCKEYRLPCICNMTWASNLVGVALVFNRNKHRPWRKPAPFSFPVDFC